MISIFAGSTWIPLSEIRWPNTTPNLHINLHLLSLKARWASWEQRSTFSKFSRASLKRITKHRKVIHINFYKIKINKNSQDFPLKGSRGITKTKWKHYVSECLPWKCKSSFILIFECNLYLVITTEAIQKGKIFLSYKGIKHLVNEREREVIFESGFV